MPPRIRLNRIQITNFKGIDHLVIDFPQPAFDHDPDICVMGSENGLGKTSVFEAIGLVNWIAASEHIAEDFNFGLIKFPESITKSIVEKSIRGGEGYCAIEVNYMLNQQDERQKQYFCGISVSNDGNISEKGILKLVRSRDFVRNGKYLPVGQMSQGLFGEFPEPFFIFPIFYMNSYRKVREGGMSLQALIEGTPRVDWHSNGAARDGDASTSTAKNQMLRALMSDAGLFEDIADDDASEALDLLNRLLGQFANVKLDKLKPGDRNTIDFRVRPLDGGGSFSFDGLSSGQKEIVSTLFLIWRVTHDSPCIVLIDEPELHLNAQWHKQVVRWLHKIAPRNQYILATHSADVFAAVPESQRILLRRGPDQ